MVFDSFRHSFDELMARATKPEDRRAIAARMKDTLVQARMGLDDLRGGVDEARRRLAAQESELATMRRRKQLAEGIKDQETVDLAAKYEQIHAERADVLRQKLAAQESELALAERDVAQMTAELRGVVAGTDPRGAAPALDPVGDAPGTAGLREELDALSRARASAERESDAARRLEELKRTMGK